MSSEISHRFETENQRQNLLKALQRQRDRIKLDEMMADRENTVRLEHEANLKAAWNESLEEASDRRKLRESKNVVQKELQLAGMAALKVRREALKRQLENEYEIYKTELNQIGKTFFVQRL